MIINLLKKIFYSIEYAINTLLYMVFGILNIVYRISMFVASPEIAGGSCLLSAIIYVVWDYTHAYSKPGIFDIICGAIVVPMLLSLIYVAGGIILCLAGVILSFLLTPFHYIFEDIIVWRKELQETLREETLRKPHENAHWKQKIPHSPDYDSFFEKQFQQFFSRYQDYQDYQEYERQTQQRYWEEEMQEAYRQAEQEYEEQQRREQQRREQQRREQQRREQQRREQQRREQQQRQQLQSAMQFFGLAPGFTQNELQKSYRKLLKLWHPDNNLDRQAHATKQFQRVQSFYTVLAENAK